MSVRRSVGRVMSQMCLKVRRSLQNRVVATLLTGSLLYLLLVWTGVTDVVIDNLAPDNIQNLVEPPRESIGQIADDRVQIEPDKRDVSTTHEEKGDKDPRVVEDFLLMQYPLNTYFSDRLEDSQPASPPVDYIDPNIQHLPLKMVLIFVSDLESPTARTLREFFARQRIEHRTTLVFDKIPSLILKGTGILRYSLFVFDEYVNYLTMNPDKKSVIDSYCQTHYVGILALTQSTRSGEIEYFSDLKIKLQHRMSLRGLKLNAQSSMWRVARPEAVYSDALPSSDWTVFLTDHSTFQPLVFSTVSSQWAGTSLNLNMAEHGCVVAVRDVGLRDQIQKVVLGYDIEFWLLDLVAMDAVTSLTHGRLSLTLDRLLQIDVDDMFVGKIGIRTKVKDAEAMVEFQEQMRKTVPGFHLVLGYSGYSYMMGNEEEVQGDKRIVELADKFIWFDHMYHHESPHNYSAEILLNKAAKNKKFAVEHSIPVLSKYMVTPHHSGIYPVHPPLYKVWTENQGVKATSSEQYPHMYPEWERRGFIYKNIKVVPRQTMRLFTVTNYFEDYNGGKPALDASIRGGYLFKIFLHTPIMVFMTHMSNYANDRLAKYAFEEEIAFIQQWTNLKLSTPGPLSLATAYFNLFPQDVQPLWGNPCDDKHMLEIWPVEKSCNRLPKFIIVGPQKTGTTALYTFLKAHPYLSSSLKDPEFFEEIQFFNFKNYMNGLDWYMEHFQVPTDKNTVLFEKSANYFDNEITPKRVQALLPRAKIVVIITDPGKRAYSWYQHMRSHNHPVALNYSFYEVVTAPDSAPRSLLEVRNRCLRPGHYATHLARWLNYFPKEQIFIIDGDLLKSDPISVVNKMQSFIDIQPFIDFKTKLRYDEGKGFYCLTDEGCLSPSKGRKYPPMTSETASYLDSYYRSHNIDLKVLLQHLAVAPPTWLTDRDS